MSPERGPIRLVGLATSPRLGGNTDTLLQALLAGAHQAGADTQHLWLGDMRIGDCTACGACHSTGVCKFQDDFQPTLTSLLAADRLVLAAPVYFAGFCAQAKRLIDRCETYWIRRHILELTPPRCSTEHLACLVAAGRDPAPGAFASLHTTAGILFATLGFGKGPGLYAGQLVTRGQVEARPEVLAAARDLGRQLARTPPADLSGQPDRYF